MEKRFQNFLAVLRELRVCGENAICKKTWIRLPSYPDGRNSTCYFCLAITSGAILL